MSTKLNNCEIVSVRLSTNGLMFRKKLERPIVFILNREDLIFLHTFFVRFPIDILLLDSDKRVTKKISMKPWRFFIGKAKYVIETKRGILDRVRVGETIEF